MTLLVSIWVSSPLLYVNIMHSIFICVCFIFVFILSYIFSFFVIFLIVAKLLNQINHIYQINKASGGLTFDSVEFVSTLFEYGS